MCYYLDNPSWYYAVTVGRRIGIYTDYADAVDQVHDYPNYRMKRFLNNDEAQAYIDYYNEGSESTQEDMGRSSSSSQGVLGASYEGFATFDEAKLYMQNEADITPRESHAVAATPSDTPIQNDPDDDYLGAAVASMSLEDKPAAKTSVEDHLVAFCSGSAILNGLRGGTAAYAVSFPLENCPMYSSEFEGNPTNNRADCLAAQQAIEIADELDPKRSRPLVIYSRYQGLVHAMADHDGKPRWIDTWEKNGWKTAKNPVEHQEIYEAFLKAEKHRTISWCFLDKKKDPARLMELHLQVHNEAEKLARATRSAA
ncbi:hypothetical protein PC121_g7615 [Phytophthora cactorum]|nr:hypothetical protein PC120_g15515 [Phytophthora cactorum]KAG3076715.1 hypothetical protein PC121_g7615 [Phytophthora cactorum]KAG4049112.1 hypothetical protein PC123_g15592 [Phytophthora cactorum]